MSESMQSVLKENLVWIVGLVVCVVVAVAAGVNAMYSGGDTPPESIREQRLVTADVDDRYIRKLLEPPPPPKTLEEETEELIQEYQEVIADENIPLKDRVRHLYAMGNLRLNNLNDVEGARDIFEQVILQYPDHSRAKRSYFRLYECYRRLGDEANMRWVCMQLMERYKPGDQEYMWAEQQLGMQITEVEPVTEGEEWDEEPEDAGEAPSPS